MLSRYDGLPPGIAVSQLFLGIGWGRSAIAHLVEREWWTGGALRSDLAAIEADRLPGVGTLLHLLGEATAPATAFVLLAVQAVVAVLLIANRRTSAALAAGVAMNLLFIAAGAVNPSIFYLVLATVVGLWMLEERLPADRLGPTARAVAGVSAFAIVVLVPLAGTLDPARVIEDPAMVLSSYAALLVVVAITMIRRAPAAEVWEPDDWAEAWEMAPEEPADILEAISRY